MLVEDQNLFPIDRAIYVKPGYFITRTGEVFSNRRNKLQRLCGTLDQYGDRTFSFITGTRAPNYRIKARDLIELCRADDSFVTETCLQPRETIVAGNPRLTGSLNKNIKSKQVHMTVHAQTIDQGLQKKGWIIGRVHKDSLVFGSEPKIHLTPESVKGEMEVLAIKYPGTKFVEFKIGATVISGGTTWA